jgi:hypothetical protein
MAITSAAPAGHAAGGEAEEAEAEDGDGFSREIAGGFEGRGHRGRAAARRTGEFERQLRREFHDRRAGGQQADVGEATGEDPAVNCPLVAVFDSPLALLRQAAAAVLARTTRGHDRPDHGIAHGQCRASTIPSLPVGDRRDPAHDLVAEHRRHTDLPSS